MAYDLDSIKNNECEPPIIIIHGDSGVGKTTFGSYAPNPIFLKTENGLGNLKVKSFPVVNEYSQIIEAITTLYVEEHNFKTLVIDSVDWLEPLIWNHVCEMWEDKRGNQKRLVSIEDAGYGKGYIEADRYWRELLKGLVALRDFRKMNIILIAHSAKIKVEDPMFPTYDTYDLKLHKRAMGILTEFADIIIYAQKHIVITTDKKDRNRAVSNGKHIMHVVGQPSFKAKNRYHLPPIPLDLSWDALSQALAESEFFKKNDIDSEINQQGGENDR